MRTLTVLALLSLASAALAIPRPVRFAFRPDRDVKTVAVAGSFNGWSKTAAPMQRAGVGGPFEATLELAEGRHFYKFVLDGATFIADPRQPERVPDGFGAYNSVVVVGPVDARPARQGDGVISQAFLRHRGRPRDLGRLPDGRVAVRFTARAADVESVSLVLSDRAVPMRAVATDGDEELFEALLTHPPARYLFRVTDGSHTLHAGPDGLAARASAAGTYTSDALPPHGAPAWLADAVFYQIFPERFANGDATNDPPGTIAWNAPPTNSSWAGGDLEGVRTHLDHLVNLGVTALYLNPIFEADSNHGYNTADYETVARRFGGNAAFDRLLADTRKRSLRLVLDGVFNHTGTAFFAFQDLIKRGASSAYASWYRVHSWPIDATSPKPNYECWWGFGTLPRLMVDVNPAVRDYLLGVVRRWTVVAGVDGWRLDVPNEVDHPFWKAFRTAVRAANPHAYIVGEIWEDGSPWLQGDEFDGVMNYRFRRAMLEFVAKGTVDATAAARQLDRVRMDYPPGTTLALYNLLGSHDTERFLTLANRDTWRLHAATTALLTTPGVPSIYYGDELAMEGGKDPDNRRGMDWGRARESNATLAHHRRVIALRHSLGLGRFGEATHRALSPDLLAFTRPGPGGQLLAVLINRGFAAKLPPSILDPAYSWRMVLGHRGRLAARTTTVLLGSPRSFNSAGPR